MKTGLDWKRAWFALAGWLGVLAGMTGAPAAAQGVAMVTDISGKVTAQLPLTITAEIPADALLQVESGARLVVIYFKSGDEYTITGPAQVQFRRSEPQSISGAAPQKRTSPVAKGGVPIQPGVRAAVFVMRGGRPAARIRLLTLSGTKILDQEPEFRWQEFEPSLRYRFELTDDTGKTLHEAAISGGSLKLPSSVKLREGATYTWEVSTRAKDGRRYTSAGDFSVATADLRSQADALRPDPGAPVSDRVAYAAWLEQMELRDEARKYWKALAAERHEDAGLRALATE